MFTILTRLLGVDGARIVAAAHSDVMRARRKR